MILTDSSQVTTGASIRARLRHGQVEATVTGTVYATAWDDNDNVTAAVIAGLAEEFVIVANAAGKEMFQLNYRDVKAIGVIGQDSEGNKTLTVSSYEVMPE